MTLDIARAWKDQDYFHQLSDEQRSLVPTHPIADLDLADEIMQQIFGGTGAPSDIPSWPWDSSLLVCSILIC